MTGERNPTGSKILLMIDTPLLVKGFPSEETVKTNVSLFRSNFNLDFSAQVTLHSVGQYL